MPLKEANQSKVIYKGIASRSHVKTQALTTSKKYSTHSVIEFILYSKNKSIFQILYIFYFRK